MHKQMKPHPHVALVRRLLVPRTRDLQDRLRHPCYYGDFRYHFRYHWPERLLCESMKDMNEVGQEDRITVHQKLASKTGFTGLSHLHHLYYLYKFDVLKDVGFDTMHTLLLRIISRHLDLYMQKGFIKNSEIDKRLLAMPWTSGLSHYYNVHVQSHY